MGPSEAQARAADLLERLAPQPGQEGPTTDELHRVFHDYARDFCKEKVLSPGRFCVAARAVLAKWGNQ